MASETSKLGSELRYRVKAPPQRIVLDLEQIEATDRKYSRARKKYQTLLTISSVSIFLSFFLMFLLPLGITVLAVAIITTFYFYHYHKKYSRLKIDPYRYFIVKKLTDLLHRDLGENEQLNLDLDFTKPIIAHKQIGEGDHPLRSGWKLKIYRDPWLNIQGQFCDRTNFNLDIVENYRHASGWKRSRSGKRKHKSKTKFKGSEICLQLSYSSKKYGAIHILKNDAIDAIQLPQFAELKSFKITDKLILIKVKVQQQLDRQVNLQFYEVHKLDTTYQTVTAMLLSAYQMLNLARTLSKSNN